MQQHDTIRGEQFIDLGEKLAVVRDADMLEHANRDDAVEFLREMPVVQQLEFDAVR